MPIDRQRLLSIARGEITFNLGVTGVEALVTPRLTPKSPGITPITPLTYEKTKLLKRSILGVMDGVRRPVSPWVEPSQAKPDLSHVIQKACCVCGDGHAQFGIMFSWRDPSKAKWYCAEHYEMVIVSSEDT